MSAGHPVDSQGCSKGPKLVLEERLLEVSSVQQNLLCYRNACHVHCAKE